MLLDLPSFYSELGIFERFMLITGKHSYLTGAAFQQKEQSSFLQMHMYRQFLQTKDIEIEKVFEWFFAEYLKKEFGAESFRFNPSGATTFLDRSRNLFAEMESILRQFTLYAENGELDRELLAISSEQITYKDLPSLISQKYLALTDNKDIAKILHLLFSDQSGLTFINKKLKDRDLARLVIRRTIKYDDFLDHQKNSIDYLMGQGIFEDTGERVRFSSADQFLILKRLFDYEALNYHHLYEDQRIEADEMASKGWLTPQSRLLTENEGSYFNYCLNQKEFSNGPDLRNKYLHGSQPDGEDKVEHYQTYITALKLMVALIIKINDDFCLDDSLAKTTLDMKNT